jgi:hypothetical protein
MSTVSKTGVAAHIYSASPGGPRGQASLSIASLKAAENAIWLCATHASLVDKNRGSDFPPSVLASYKSFHETAVYREHTGIKAPLGWFHQMRIFESPIFQTPTIIRFGQLTSFSGQNESGKTSLWEWLAATSDPSRALKRWRGNWLGDLSLRFEVTYFNPQANVLYIEVSKSGSVKFELNEMPVPFNPIATRFVVLRQYDKSGLEDHEKGLWDNWSDLERIATVLGIDLLALENILPSVGKIDGVVERIWVDPIRADELMVQLSEGWTPYPFRTLSTSEQVRVLIGIGIAIANFSAGYIPSVLVIESFRSFDIHNQHLLAHYLASPERLFQTIVESHSLENFGSLKLSALWETVALEGRRSNVLIRQNEIRE